MKKLVWMFIGFSFIMLSCGRQIPEGTTIKVVNDCNYSNDEMDEFISSLEYDLEGYNFTILESGNSDYTIRINSFSKSISASEEYPPSDACDRSPQMLETTTISVSIDLCEYSASVLESWTKNKTYGESFVKRLIGGEGDGCTNYRVGKDIFDLAGYFKDLPKKVAKKTSRIVYRQ